MLVFNGLRHYRRGHTQRPYAESAIFFLDKLPYTGHTEMHTRRSYVELVFNWGSPYVGQSYAKAIKEFVFRYFFI